MHETGRVLRAARENAGLSLATFAARVHYGKSTLSMVETGQRTATPELVAAYERTLGVQGLGDDVNRRELLAATAALLAGTAISDPAARLLDGLSSAGHTGQVGRSEVEAIRHAAAVYTAMDLKYGGAVTADLSHSALRWAVGLLDAPMRDDIRVELHAAVGSLADRTAWMHFDAGRGHSARTLSTLALRTADGGADPDLRAHVLLDIAMQVGEVFPGEAAKLIDSALADRRVCSLERANLHAEMGRHSAKAGDKQKALQHIRRAELLASSGGDAPMWAGFLTVNHLDAVITRSLAAAGEHAEAIRRFENLLPRVGDDRLRGRAGWMIDLADVYTDTGELERAATLARQADGALQEVRSTRKAAKLAALKSRVTQARHGQSRQS
ncbi:helix-turn-helix domain-containing protein [Actinokineospora inagensis]|uniref:helix-turn-helix domain-containing protein n=1 Tax=Actinokineospora inagensis TaxID=103730 RepID=UPI00047B3388|nr:helix-turn-helix transcriptional regulator [Actinokineospora inagensis]